uniref:G-protein coupled receptors family 1 profile domain-containing protein n=1 Tax=Plectus sambesii TaxID=2011161 RepID=A0A914VHH4_9BILA
MAIDNYIIHLSYGSQSVVIFIVNGLLLLTILSDPLLRKRNEKHIIAYMAGADVFYGLSTVMMAVHRMIVVSLGEQNVMVTSWDCIKYPSISLTYIGVQLTSVMNVVVSSDRLIAIVWPLAYRNFDKGYTRKVLVGKF